MLLARLFIAGGCLLPLSEAAAPPQAADEDPFWKELGELDDGSFAKLKEVKSLSNAYSYLQNKPRVSAELLDETELAFDVFFSSYAKRYLGYFKAALDLYCHHVDSVGPHTLKLIRYGRVKKTLEKYSNVLKNVPYAAQLAKFLGQLDIGKRQFEYAGSGRTSGELGITSQNFDCYYNLASSTISLFVCMARGISTLRVISEGMLARNDLSLKPQSYSRVCQILGEVGPAARNFVASLNAFVEIIKSQSRESIAHLLPYVNVQLDLSPLSLFPEFCELARSFRARCGENDPSILEELRILENVDAIYTERISDGLFHALSEYFEADEWVVAHLEQLKHVNWALELPQRRVILTGLEAGFVFRDSPVILELLKRDSQEYPVYLSGLLGPLGEDLVKTTGAIFDMIGITTSLRARAAKHALQASTHPSLPRLQALLLQAQMENIFPADLSGWELITGLKKIVGEATLAKVEKLCWASSFYDSAFELKKSFARIERVIVVTQMALELLEKSQPDAVKPSLVKGLERLRDAAAHRLRFNESLVEISCENVSSLGADFMEQF